MTPEDRVVAIRDGAVRFRVLSGGRGPDLLYFHSFHDRDGWPPLLDSLSERFTVRAPFHPGVHGSEGVEALDDVVDLALAYDELLSALGIEAAYLAGHGFGAMMAAELASLCPHRARRLCLASPLGLWLDGKPVADVAVLPLASLRVLLWKDPECDPARRWSAVPTSPQESVEFQIEQIQRLAAMVKFVWPIPDKGLRRRLHRLAAPALLLWGDDDRVNPREYGMEFTRLIRGAELRTVSAGHMLHLEAADAVARAVATFFT